MQQPQPQLVPAVAGPGRGHPRPVVSQVRFMRFRTTFISSLDEHSAAPPGGGGGTQIWFRRGCAAEAAKPIPIFKGHFGGKGYLLLRVFSQENDVFVYFSDEMGENYKSGGYV